MMKLQKQIEFFARTIMLHYMHRIDKRRLSGLEYARVKRKQEVRTRSIFCFQCFKTTVGYGEQFHHISYKETWSLTMCSDKK